MNDAGVFSLFFWRLLVLLSLVVVLSGCGSSVTDNKNSAPRAGDKWSELRIKTATAEHKFSVELALDEQSQAKGLMFRREMPADHGMLFIYHKEHPIAMWMKNTLLSLDMLFVKKDGTITKIAQNAEPLSETIIPSGGPVYGVLELNAGTADRLSIHVGDRLLHPLLNRP